VHSSNLNRKVDGTCLSGGISNPNLLPPSRFSPQTESAKVERNATKRTTTINERGEARQGRRDKESGPDFSRARKKGALREPEWEIFGRGGGYQPRADRTRYAFSLSSSAFASFRSAVSKPSVNQP
jgi:hypothetical protein